MWYRKLQTSARSLGKDESGANAVEFALVAPVLIILMLGIIQFGMILYTHNNMVQAAREASRILAQPTQDISSAKLAAASQLDCDAKGPGDDCPSITKNGWVYEIIRCEPVTKEGGGGPACTGPGIDPSNAVRVTIKVPLSQASLIDFLGLFTGDLEARVIMHKEPKEEPEA